MQKWDNFQTTAMVSLLEFLADTFDGDLQEKLVDDFMNEGTGDAFRALFLNMHDSIKETCFHDVNFGFSHDATLNFGGNPTRAVLLMIPLDEEDSVKMLYAHTETGQQFMSFSHDGLTLLSGHVWFQFDPTGFTHIRDNTLPGAAPVVAKILAAMPVRDEVEPVRQFALLTWMKRGVNNKVLSDVKSICAMTDILFPKAHAEELANMLLPNGMARFELVDIAQVDSALRAIDGRLEQQRVSLHVTANEPLGYFGCSLTQTIADKTKKSSDIHIDLCSGTPASQGALVIYSEAAKAAFVECHVHHDAPLYPLSYDKDALFAALSRAGEQGENVKHMVAKLRRHTEVFRDYFAKDDLLALALLNHLHQDLGAYAASLENA